MKKIITFCSMYFLLSTTVTFAMSKYAISTTDPGVDCANCHDDGRTWVSPVTTPPVTTPPITTPPVTTPPTTTTDEPNTVYRFYNTERSTHFYTASVEEKNTILDTRPEFSYEGVAFKSASDVGSASLAPVYRFYNTTTETHFYTISESERDYILAHYNNIIFEGYAYNAYTTNVPGTVGLHRFFNSQTGTHFYTASESEKQNVQNNNPQYLYEGIVYYIENATAVNSAAGSTGGTTTDGSATINAVAELDTTCLTCHSDKQNTVSCSNSKWTGHNGSKVTAAIYSAVTQFKTGGACTTTTSDGHENGDENEEEHEADREND